MVYNEKTVSPFLANVLFLLLRLFLFFPLVFVVVFFLLVLFPATITTPSPSPHLQILFLADLTVEAIFHMKPFIRQQEGFLQFRRKICINSLRKSSFKEKLRDCFRVWHEILLLLQKIWQKDNCSYMFYERNPAL